MKARLIGLILIIFITPFVADAGDVPLPAEHEACAFVVKSEKRGLWEKSLVVRFPKTRRVLSTNEGAVEVMAVVNHSAHPSLWVEVGRTMATKWEDGGKVYEARARGAIASELGIRLRDIAMMSTAADMDNMAVVTRRYAPFIVTAIVTAGAKTNALRTGVDEGNYVETDPVSGCKRTRDAPAHGTVNVIILVNAGLSDGAMARAIITVTEAKTAAFEDLRIPSSYTPAVQATGTGTDSMMIVSGRSGPSVTYTGGHSRIGELIGRAVYEAVVEALRKQNGFQKVAAGPRKGDPCNAKRGGEALQPAMNSR